MLGAVLQRASTDTLQRKRTPTVYVCTSVVHDHLLPLHPQCFYQSCLMVDQEGRQRLPDLQSSVIQHGYVSTLKCYDPMFAVHATCCRRIHTHFHRFRLLHCVCKPVFLRGPLSKGLRAPYLTYRCVSDYPRCRKAVRRQKR